MKASHLKILIFGVACVLTMTVWSFFWPAGAGTVKPLPPAVRETDTSRSEPKAWPTDQIRAAIDACVRADTKEAQMRAAMELGKIPIANVQEALEAVPAAEDGELTLAAKVLLIRWAGSDGAAAVQWAWTHLRPSSGSDTWTEAFNEIGPAWAWHDAAGFHRWVSRLKNLGQSGIPEAVAEDSVTPQLDLMQVSSVCLWIAQEKPRLAYELMLQRGGFSTTDIKLCESFSLAQIKEVSAVLPEVVPSTSGVYADKQIHSQILLERWQKLDPDDFARSPYAMLLKADRHRASVAAVTEWKAQAPADRAAAATRLVDAHRHRDGFQNVDAWGPLPAGADMIVQGCIGGIAAAWADVDPNSAVQWLETLPEAERHVGYSAMAASAAPRDLNLALTQVEKLSAPQRLEGTVRAFQAWREAHPGQQPDTRGWSAQRAAAWRDLEFLAE